MGVLNRVVRHASCLEKPAPNDSRLKTLTPTQGHTGLCSSRNSWGVTWTDSRHPARQDGTQEPGPQGKKESDQAKVRVQGCGSSGGEPCSAWGLGGYVLGTGVDTEMCRRGGACWGAEGLHVPRRGQLAGLRPGPVPGSPQLTGEGGEEVRRQGFTGTCWVRCFWLPALVPERQPVRPYGEGLSSATSAGAYFC